MSIPGRLENRHCGPLWGQGPSQFPSHHYLLSWSLAISLLQRASRMVPWPAGVPQLCAPRCTPIPQTWPLNWIPVVMLQHFSEYPPSNHLLAFKHNVLLFSIPPSPSLLLSLKLPSPCLPCEVELIFFSFGGLIKYFAEVQSGFSPLWNRSFISKRGNWD